LSFTDKQQASSIKLKDLRFGRNPTGNHTG